MFPHRHRYWPSYRHGQSHRQPERDYLRQSHWPTSSHASSPSSWSVTKTGCCQVSPEPSRPCRVAAAGEGSPSENRNDVASVASAAARFPAQFPPFPLSVISRDASARDATLSIFNDLQAAGARNNLVGRWGMKRRINLKVCEEIGFC